MTSPFTKWKGGIPLTIAFFLLFFFLLSFFFFLFPSLFIFLFCKAFSLHNMQSMCPCTRLIQLPRVLNWVTCELSVQAISFQGGTGFRSRGRPYKSPLAPRIHMHKVSINIQDTFGDCYCLCSLGCERRMGRLSDAEKAGNDSSHRYDGHDTRHNNPVEAQAAISLCQNGDVI